MSHIQENIKYLASEITKTAKDCGRDPKDITLIAVSKTFGAEVIPEAMKAGQTIFAENRVQEGEEKRNLLTDIDFEYHLIGHLQTNKVNKAIRYFDMIHSVDSYDLAKKINDSCSRENKVMPILVQINTSAEEQKSGFPYSQDNIYSLIENLIKLPHINLKGLMTIGPLSIEENLTRECFTKLREIREDLIHKFSISLEHLSMGMSHDFKWAIQEGSTMLRIGSSIFGQRSYPIV